MAPRKLLETEDTLWEKFATVTNEFGEGNKNARGIVPLHPTGHWGTDVEIERYARKAFALEALQTLRPQGWLEAGMRKAGVDEFWVLERIIAAALDYSGDDYESLMKIFFRAWESDLKPDGRSKKNKAQWVRWCELHLVRHHRTSKAQRVIDVLHELGLLYPGWWKQIYAQLHGTAISNANFLSPWDDQPSINLAEIDALNQSYARMPRTVVPLKDQPAMPPQRSNRQPPKSGTRAPRKQTTRKRPTDSAMDTPESETETDVPTNKRVKTARFAEALEEINAASPDATESRDPDKDNGNDNDNDSDASFTPEDYYPDWVHEHDAIVGRPATTYPQLSHTIGFAPAAEAWRILDEPAFDQATCFNPQLNATTIIDSASQDAVARPARPQNSVFANFPAFHSDGDASEHQNAYDVSWYTPTADDLAMLPPDDDDDDDF